MAALVPGDPSSGPIWIVSYFRSFVLSYFRTFIVSYFRSFVLSYFRIFGRDFQLKIAIEGVACGPRRDFWL